jgi:hypothetical protein
MVHRGKLVSKIAQHLRSRGQILAATVPNNVGGSDANSNQPTVVAVRSEKLY